MTAHETPRGVFAESFPVHDFLNPWWDAFDAHVDVIWEKSRRMMASWSIMAAFLHDLLFKPDCGLIVISQKERKTDDGGRSSTWESLLGKVRFMYNRLPDWLQREAPLDFSFLKIHCASSGSTIIGEASVADAARSGGYWRAVMDEAAYIPHGESVFSGLRSACPAGLILASTPNGKANVFYRLRKKEGISARLIRTHWMQHPDRRCDCLPGEHRGCWYAHEQETLTPLQMARENDISYESSVAGRVWYGWSDDFVGDVPMLDGPTIWRGWDFGVGDQTAIIMAQVATLPLASGRTTKQLRIFDGYRNSDQGALHYRDILQHKAASYNGGGLRDYGDPYNLKSRDSALTSWQKNLADARHPYKIDVQPSGCRGNPDEVVIDNARKFMQMVECADGTRQPRLLVDRELKSLIECFEGWSYPTDDEDQVIGTAPKHDVMSHYMCAYKYLCWAVSPISGLPEHFKESDAEIIDAADPFREEVIW